MVSSNFEVIRFFRERLVPRLEEMRNKERRG
jgi:hypothetical protein